VGFAQKGPANTLTLVTNWTQYVEQFGDFMAGSYLAHSVYGYFNNGGGRCYIMRIGASDDAGGAEPGAAVSLLPANTGAELNSVTITALGEPTDLIVEITDAAAGEEGGTPDPEQFNLIVRQGGNQVESFENLTLNTGRGRNVRNAATVVNETSTLIRIAISEAGSELPLAERRPKAGSYSFAVPAVAGEGAASTTALAVTPSDFAGSTPDRTGMGGLVVAEDITMLVVPDLMAAYEQGTIDLEGVQAVQLAMISHCENMGDRVAILDAPPGMKAQEIQNWRVNIANYDSSYAALYYPWIRVFDPVAGKSALMPPSGHMAGIWARNDNTRGNQLYTNVPRQGCPRLGSQDSF
jgi:phage tail sheath protein FI